MVFCLRIGADRVCRKGKISSSLLYECMAEAVPVVSWFLSVGRAGRGYALGVESSGSLALYHRSGYLCAICTGHHGEVYSRPDNPLLVPRSAERCGYSFLCPVCIPAFSCVMLCTFWCGRPVAADQPSDLPAEVIDALKLDPLSFNLSGTKEILGEVYRILGEIRSLYLKYRGTEHVKCFLKQSDGDQGCYLKFKTYDIEIQYLPRTDGAPAAAGAVFELDENTFLIIGMMCSIRFHTKPGDHRKVDFLTKEAGTFRDGKWGCDQRQNGDEKIVSVLYNMPGCFRIETFKY